MARNTFFEDFLEGQRIGAEEKRKEQSSRLQQQQFDLLSRQSAQQEKIQNLKIRAAEEELKKEKAANRLWTEYVSDLKRLKRKKETTKEKKQLIDEELRKTKIIDKLPIPVQVKVTKTMDAIRAGKQGVGLEKELNDFSSKKKELLEDYLLAAKPQMFAQTLQKQTPSALESLKGEKITADIGGIEVRKFKTEIDTLEKALLIAESGKNKKLIKDMKELIQQKTEKQFPALEKLRMKSETKKSGKRGTTTKFFSGLGREALKAIDTLSKRFLPEE